MKTVCVLLSTFNGEKFIREQLDSLLLQEGVDINILARDDGSKDKTVAILEEYSQKDARISYFVGENVKPAQSFLDLIRKSPQSDYYAFCDQDDVWDSDKLKIAVDYLEQEDTHQPNLYYSNLRIVDQNLKFYHLMHDTPRVQNNKYSALTEDVATGCTMVFNRKTVELVRERFPEYCSMHDTWIYLVCKFLGNVVYDFKAHIDYRQHGNNVIGASLEQKSIDIYIERFKRLFDRNLQPRYNNAKNFYKCFGALLNQKDTEKVMKVVRYKDSIWKRLSLLFDKEIHSSSNSREIRYRLLIILGIV